MTVPLGVATTADVRACAAVLAEALADDPALHRLVPGEHDRHSRVAAVYEGTVRGALVSGIVDVARREPGGPVIGVAVWEAPDRRRAPLVGLRGLPRAVGAVGVRNLRASHAESARYAAARPATPHWYLTDIAVGGAARGLGVGSALLRHRLATIDADGAAAYLEATSPVNQRLYERFGFAPRGRIGGPGDDEGLTTMWRPAQG
ncbi:ribosomal protein S18 acetylase RimI-like enzyme [Nocardioides zeae]|uniref:Ribosomal protein S18 acetylase RimI-like enzyme n=1 Tax=Nocardioides zeae TaxID=1457234 RepID=A0ACC6II42_9ACTN|nr:GNAT family N-acetyltransferase [Nocardioides zeae]MDR6176194.1 ribosomal protein S18 acetylase RimI-like enzyme [Nocardioides zeae]MDR6210340.1 ribosomal protein S18 acetylase RimI-like enzyme [Nocardioides zeae]